jgi:hypothetical protein
MGAMLSEKAEFIWRLAPPRAATAPKANGAGRSRAAKNR